MIFFFYFMIPLTNKPLDVEDLNPYEWMGVTCKYVYTKVNSSLRYSGASALRHLFKIVGRFSQMRLSMVCHFSILNI